MSKNKPTIAQIKIACRHIDELMKADVTLNHAIRTLELLADMYAKTHNGGKASVHHVNEVPLAQWSLAALRARKKNPNAKAGSYLRVEHGTPKRVFAKKVMDRNKSKIGLTERGMAQLVQKFWRLAVITHEEDARLNRQSFPTPQERWASAGIRFPKNSPNAPIPK